MAQNLLVRFTSSSYLHRLLCNNRTLIQPPCAGIKHDTKKALSESNLPEKPKQPATAYIRFVSERHAHLQKEYPNLKNTEIMKKCAERWREIDDTQKARLVEQYKKDRERYAEECLKYDKILTPEQKELLKNYADEKKKYRARKILKKKLEEHNKPKRPVPAYIMYLKDAAIKENKKFSEILKTSKGLWQSLPEETKSVYEKKAQVLKEQYEKELAAWELQMIKEDNSDLVRQKTLQNERPDSSRKVRPQ